MANLLGDLWEPQPPAWHKLLREDGVALHLYGKTQAKPGRKMGHITAMAETVDAARDRLTSARSLIQG